MYEKKKGDAVTGIQVLLKKKAESFLLHNALHWEAND